MKTKKKALLIGLSVFGGSVLSAAFVAAFICTTPASMTQEDYDNFEDFAFINSGEHVSSYKTNFGDKQTTSAYGVKYDNTIKEASEKLNVYADSKNVEHGNDSPIVFTFEKESNNLAALYFDNFMDNLGKEIEEFFNQIKQDREKVHADYKINYATLKKAYNNDVARLQDDILDCERYIAELDRDDEDYEYKVEGYQEQIEITRVELINTQAKYESDVAYLNETYETDLYALDLAEEQVVELKENYELQVANEEIAPITPIEYVVEEIKEEQIEIAPAPAPVHSAIYREAKAVSIKEDEEIEVVTSEVMVETVSEFNPDLFTFKCFDNCYLYIEPKDKDSYWHF